MGPEMRKPPEAGNVNVVFLDLGGYVYGIFDLTT